MNEVQTVYHRFFETEQMFSESRDSIEVLRLSIDSSRRAKYQELELRVSDIPYAFDGEAKETGSLTLFRVGKNFADGVLSISREAFEFVFERCSIAPQLKYMITRDLPGFQSFLNDEHVPTFYFNEPPYTIVWSYDTKSLASRGLFIYRINDRFPQRGAIAYQDILKDHSTLCATPLLPLWVGITQSLLFVEATFHKERQEIREVEAVTLHSPWYRDNKGWGYIEDTATQSQRITASIVSCADVERHIRSLEVGLEFLHDSHHRAWFDALSPDQLLIVQDQERKIEAAADFVAARLNAIIHYLEYLQKRARAQLAVLQSISIRHDARVSIQLAQAAKQDSSSMKTIAVMTMVFLPGTFFATLFALPSLHWDESGVITSQFWVYWAITLPATAIVFACWMLATSQTDVNFLRGLLSSRSPSLSLPWATNRLK